MKSIETVAKKDCAAETDDDSAAFWLHNEWMALTMMFEGAGYYEAALADPEVWAAYRADRHRLQELRACFPIARHERPNGGVNAPGSSTAVQHLTTWLKVLDDAELAGLIAFMEARPERVLAYAKAEQELRRGAQSVDAHRPDPSSI